MGLWIRLYQNVDFTCYDCIAADNRLVFRYSFHQKLKDSLIVGLSENYKCSKDFYWHNFGESTARALCLKATGLHLYMGYALYDGPGELYRVHFANFYGGMFPPKSFGFMNMMAALKRVATIAQRISFSENVPFYARVDLVEVPSSSLWTTQLIDEDGSVTGIPNAVVIPEILTVKETSLLVDLEHAGFNAFNGIQFQWDKNFNLPPSGDSGTCLKFGNGTYSANSWICNQRLGLLIMYTYGALKSDTGIRAINVTRSDGYKVTDQFRDGANFPYHTAVYLNKTSIHYGMETPLRVPKLSLKLMEVVPNDFVIFRVDQTNPNSEYYLFVGYAHIRLYSKTSMNEMNLCPESCVFFNSSVNSTWMKVVAKA
jgi:hypothetical protein